MKKVTDALAEQLLSHVYTTQTLRLISETLEDYAHNHGFRQHANSIVTDPNLTENQKQTQLLYLIRSIEVPILYDFFSDEVGRKQFWLFNSEKIDYFDELVKRFQVITETTHIVHLVTAVKLSQTDLKEISKNLSDSLGYKVILNHEVNPAIIGGVQMKLENFVFDLSLRTKFRQFQKQWLASLERTETLVGRNEPDSK